MGKEGVAADGRGGLRVFDRRRQSDPAFHEDEWAVARNGGRAVRRGRWASAGPAAGTRRRHGEACRSLRRCGGGGAGGGGGGARGRGGGAGGGPAGREARG